MIKVTDLHKSFGKLLVLNGVTEHIKKGEAVSIIGPSGSGKSTFLRCLNLLEMPDSGTVEFEGHVLNKKGVDINQYRRRMGMVFQSFNVFPHMSCIDNITMAPVLQKLKTKEEATAQAEELLHKVGLYEKRNEHPNKLSGGQKQRLAIVRSLAMEPDVMLFDEPTSALDPEMVGAQRYTRPCKGRHDHRYSIARNGLCARNIRPRAVHGRRQHNGARHAGRDIPASSEPQNKGFPCKGAVSLPYYGTASAFISCGGF